jgi:hypothetical protein
LGNKIINTVNSWGWPAMPVILIAVTVAALAMPGIIIAVWLQKLVCSGMHVRDHDYYKSHPAYKLAVEQGYKDGKKPS